MPILTNAQLGLVKLKAEEMWVNGQLSDQYVAYAEAAKAILKEQTAVIRPITGSQDKDNQVEVSWVDPCAVADEDCPADWCDVSASPLSTKKLPYSLNLCRASGFSIDENDIAGSIYSRDEVMALGELTAKKKLDEWLSAQGLIFLNANTGENKFPAPYTYDATNKTTNIATADYNRKIVPYFEKMAMLHEIPLPYYIDNGQLWIDWRNAQLDAGNADGKGDKARIDAIKLYFDMQGFVKAGVTPDDTFAVGKHAVALGNRYYNPDTPTKFEMRDGVQTRYNVESNNLPGIRYDVIYQLACQGKRFIHTWKYIVTAGYFLNPTGCQEGVTGIMSYTAV